MNSTEALFCKDASRVCLHPRGSDSMPGEPPNSRIPRVLTFTLAFMMAVLTTFLVTLCVVALQKQSHAPEAQAFLQDAPKPNSTGEQQEDPHFDQLAELQEALQNLQGRLENSSTGNVELQVLAYRMDNISSQVQDISGLLENTRAEVQRVQVLNGQLRNANKEIQTLKQEMKEAVAFSPKIQVLEGDLQKVNAEIQGLKGNLEEIKTLTAKIKEEEHGLVALQAALASQEQLQREQSQLLQLLLRGWKSYNGALYYFSKIKKSWQDAEDFCVSEGAHLASVTSQEEQAFLVTFTKDSFHWIGLTDKGSEGVWYWTDRTLFNDAESRKFWDTNQPDNWMYGEGGSEDCVQMQEKWNDMYCGALHQWVCKKSVGGTTPGPS